MMKEGKNEEARVEDTKRERETKEPRGRRKQLISIDKIYYEAAAAISTKLISKIWTILKRL